MTNLAVTKPADGSRLIQYHDEFLLIGQPPEVLKGLLLNNIPRFNTLLLTDTKEKDGSLLNNLEFPLYFFLFMNNDRSKNRQLNLVGSADDITRVFRLLRLTLLGPTEAELDGWGTPEHLKHEWLGASHHLALKDKQNEMRPVESFFNALPFDNDEATAGSFHVSHTGKDRYTVSVGDESVEVDLNEDEHIFPPYKLQTDAIPRDLAKLGLEILGSASGFTAEEPCTGLALCYNGNYILIDSIPYLDKHLFARGISKNSVYAIFLTHLHDDHCAMFPLLLMPHKVDVITTREIYEMAMEKLSCHLNWTSEVIKEYFNLIEVVPGEPLSYFGLEVTPHVTVHSIPTLGATFSIQHKGRDRRMCVIGDNNGMDSIREMHKLGIVSNQTYDTLCRIYSERYDLLVADGGAGAIHGEPADALKSDSDRVVFVHVEHLAHHFTTTFSLASSGKRYIVVDGDKNIYDSLTNQYLSTWLGEPLSDRWARTILAEDEIRRYNKGDVIMVQEEHSRGYVYLILTGYCDVVMFDGEDFQTVASLQAGEVIGEMAVVTGKRTRNASVVAASPVTVMVISEEHFNEIVVKEGYREKLLKRWEMRASLKELPQFDGLISTVLEKIAALADVEVIPADDTLYINEEWWYILIEGSARLDGKALSTGDELGARPFSKKVSGIMEADTQCRLAKFPQAAFGGLLGGTPQLNFLLRKYRIEQQDPAVNWLLGAVTTT